MNLSAFSERPVSDVAKRGGEAVAKRARERGRLEKQEAKREKREARSAESTSISAEDESALMEEFARLSERYSAGEITEAVYNEERTRIFEELGVESHD